VCADEKVVLDERLATGRKIEEGIRLQQLMI
jgi:hypothetical protein